MLKYLFTELFLILFLISSAQDSFNVKLLYQWKDASLPSSTSINNAYNEVWGLYRNGREYAVIGSTMGTHFFDITDSLVEVDFVPGAYQGSGVVHRDYHDYQNYLYMVCNEGPSTLQIADLSYLPDSVHLVYDSDSLFKTSHNIFIDTAKAMLYVCSEFSNTKFSPISLYRLNDPLNPQHFYSWPANVGHVHDVFVSNDTAFCNKGSMGLFIMNFSDSLNPITLGTLTIYPDQGYNHSGWLSEDRQTYVFVDETWGKGVKICDASDLSDLQIESIVRSNADPNHSMAHNLILKDNILYISYYSDGLYMFDITNRSNPELVGYYDPYLASGGFNGAWGVYPLLPSGRILVSDMQSGLFVFDTTTTVLGVNGSENKLSELKIYPNPLNDKLVLSFQVKEAGDAEYFLIDITGKVIYHKKNTFKTGTYIDHINLPENSGAGTYFLRIILPKAQFQSQFIKINQR